MQYRARNVHAAAQRDAEMGEIAADAEASGQCLCRGTCCVGFHVVERYGVMHIVADCLHPRPALVCLSEQLPSALGQQVRIAVAAAQQVDERIEGQVLHGMLPCIRAMGVWMTCIAENPVGRQGEFASRGHHARTPVAKAVTVAFEWNAGLSHEVIRALEIAEPRIMHIQQRDQWGRLGQGVGDAAADIHAQRRRAVSHRQEAGVLVHGRSFQYLARGRCQLFDQGRGSKGLPDSHPTRHVHAGWADV